MTQIGNSALPTELTSLSAPQFFSGVLSTAVTGGIVIGGVIFFFVLVTGGIKWMTAGSDKAAYQEARAKLMMGFIGLAILLSTFAIIIFIEAIFNISILNINLEPLVITS